jgi:hypothetical protein
MAELNHNHQVFRNEILQNEIEDQINSHLNLMQFCTLDNSLVGVAGDRKRIRRYHATDATEKLGMGEGNTKNIEVAYSEVDYEILMAQNRFPYYDEELMRDPLVVETGVRHMTTDMFNTTQADIYTEFSKATQVVNVTAFDFAAFVDAMATLNREHGESEDCFAFVAPADMASIRKGLKDDLKYVEAYVRQGYVGTVAGGCHLYVKKDATPGTIVGGTKKAVTFFNKRGVEVEQERDPNVRLNKIYSRKYYLVALTDENECFKIVKA